MNSPNNSISGKILVIDDDEIIVSLIEKILSKDGYTVLCASNGNEGLNLARSEKPDLILMDVNMPGLSGYDVTELLKKEDFLRNIPVLYLSGQSPDDSGKKAFASGGATFIKKPFGNEQLRQIIMLAMMSIRVS